MPWSQKLSSRFTSCDMRAYKMLQGTLPGTCTKGDVSLGSASVFVENSHKSTSTGLMEIINSTEKLAVLVTHVSVSHKLCQGIQFLPYSASANSHEENSKILMEFANFTNTHGSKANLTVAERLYFKNFLKKCI